MTRKPKKSRALEIAVADFADSYYAPGDGGVHPGTRYVRRGARKIIEMIRKNCPKKLRRVVLGEGYPWFIRVDGGRYGGVNMFKRAAKSIGEVPPNLHLKISDLCHEQRIRLVAEIIEEKK